MSENHCLVKVDFKNAFNCIDRAVFLDKLSIIAPQIYNFVAASYYYSSTLFYQKKTINSMTGVQQGDPLGPALFSIGIHDIIKELKSSFNVWYLDDGTFGDKDPLTTFSDFLHVVKSAEKIGLRINESKCELICNSQSTINRFKEVFPSIKIVSPLDCSFLGSPAGSTDSYNRTLQAFCEKTQCYINKMAHLNKHISFFLLQKCLLGPKITFLLRSAPLFLANIAHLETRIRDWYSTLLNINFSSSKMWNMAVLAFLTSPLMLCHFFYAQITAQLTSNLYFFRIVLCPKKMLLHLQGQLLKVP